MHTDDLTFAKIQHLQEESDDIRWQVISRQAMLTFSDSAAQHLLDIQGADWTSTEISSVFLFPPTDCKLGNRCSVSTGSWSGSQSSV